MPNYHSAELERNLLGLLIMFPDKVQEAKDAGVSPSLFYVESNAHVFSAIDEVVAGRTGLDTLAPALVCEAAKKRDANISSSLISSLTDGVPKTSVKNLPDIISKLAVFSQKREMWKAVKRLEKALNSGDDETAEAQVERIASMSIASPHRRDKALVDDVRDWVSVVAGEFNILDIYKDLGIVHKNDRKNVSVILGRMSKDGVIRRAGKKNGVFRKADSVAESINWVNAPMEAMPITFPLDIHDLVNIYSGNVIVAAGAQNSGKTALCLNFALANQDKYEVHYFSSEMGATETRIRLELMPVLPEDIKIKFWERVDDFEDVIRPDAINIIDFLELNDEFYKVGARIGRIYERLGKGIALIGLQKDIGRDYGRGGSMGLEKPRLYVAINPGTIKIVKAKNWKGHENPNNLVRDFKLVDGWNFIPQGPWRHEAVKVQGQKFAPHGQFKI